MLCAWRARARVFGISMRTAGDQETSGPCDDAAAAVRMVRKGARTTRNTRGTRVQRTSSVLRPGVVAHESLPDFQSGYEGKSLRGLLSLLKWPRYKLPSGRVVIGESLSFKSSKRRGESGEQRRERKPLGKEVCIAAERRI